jgi:hypothetical protein
MKRYNSKFGKLIQWSDYIRTKKDNKTGETYYLQSNVKIDNHNQRYIGLYLSHSNKVYIAVAVNKKNDAGNWWKYIIENRIMSLINNGDNMTPDDRGVTMVPYDYIDLLYKDEAVFNNLYGKIDPTTLELAIKELKIEQEREIEARWNENSTGNSK